jgi:hypothetical protein
MNVLKTVSWTVWQSVRVFFMAVLRPVWQLVSLVVMPANNSSLTVGSRVVLQSYGTRSIGSFVASLAVCS